MQKNASLINIPGAIIIAGAIIAIAIIWAKKPVQVAVPPQQEQQQIEIPGVTATDHIMGNPNAEITIVEYSDPSCPWCKALHPEMEKLLKEYGPSGKVAWVYRHFPIDKEGTRPDGGILHPNAGHEAQAMECADDLGGKDKFWAFLSKFYATTPSVTSKSPEGLDQSKLPEIASSVGLDAKVFEACLSSGKFKDKIEKQYQEATKAGITGTPASVIIMKGKPNVSLPGYLPYDNLKNVIDTLLSQA